MIPGTTPSCEVDAVTGPTSSLCSQMHFFATPEAAETWVSNYPGTAVLTLEEANQVARTFTEDRCCDCC